MAPANKNEEFKQAFEHGIAQFNEGFFFETHETWEEIWLSAAEPDRTRLQGLIQIAAAFHHYQRGNRAGALSLLAAGLRKLEGAADDLFGMNFAKLRQAAQWWLAALKENKQPGADFLPQIERK